MVQRLTLESRLKEHQGCVNCINFSWAGNLLASGSDDLQVVLWDWAGGKVVKKFDTGHVANVFQVSCCGSYWNACLFVAVVIGSVATPILQTACIPA